MMNKKETLKKELNQRTEKLLKKFFKKGKKGKSLKKGAPVGHQGKRKRQEKIDRYIDI